MSKRKSKKSKNTTLIVFFSDNFIIAIALLLYFFLWKEKLRVKINVSVAMVVAEDIMTEENTTFGTQTKMINHSHQVQTTIINHVENTEPVQTKTTIGSLNNFLNGLCIFLIHFRVILYNKNEKFKIFPEYFKYNEIRM